MDLFEYVDRMKALGSPVAVVAIVLLCLFLLLIILKMLGGMRRGGWKQLVRTVLTLAAAVVGYSIATMISGSVMGSINEKSIGDFIAMMEGLIPGIGDILRTILSTFDPSVFEYVIILPVTILLMPALATGIFLLINLILQILRNVFIKIFGFKAAKGNPQKLGGALLGAAEAIIWAIMITLPITGLMSLADRACDDLLNSDGNAEDTELISTYEEYILPFTENPAYTFMDSLGAGALSDGIATVVINGEKTNLREEIRSVVGICLIEIPSLEGADFGALTEQNKQSIDNIVNAINRSPFVSSIAAGVVQSSSGFMNSDLIPIDKAGEGGKLLAGILDFLEGVTQESLGEDITTIKNLYYLISDSRIIKELEENENADVLALLQEKRKEGDDTVSKMIDILGENERCAPIVRAMTEILLSSLSAGVTLPNGETVNVSYDSLKNDMQQVLDIDREDYATEKQYVDAVAESLGSTLSDNGIELEGEIVDSIAEYISREYSNVEEISDEQFNDILLSYYDAYLEYIGG